LLTIAVWNTTITQFLWIGGLAAVPDITRGSYLFFLKPVIASVLAVVFLGTVLTVPQVLAIVLICGSVGVGWIWSKRMANKAEAQ
jgi:threonine/homoserine efflux transporter RhtA